jgi:hypothetical protein
MNLSVRPATLRPLLFSALALVTVAGVAVEVLKATAGWSGREGAVPLFSLSYEQNVPTWYAAALLLANALLLAIAAAEARARGGPFVGHWWGACVAMVYISLDEVVEIHEAASKWFSFGGVLYFGWVIPAAAVLVVLGLLYLPFVRALPPAMRRRSVIAGVVYVGGALGMELPLGWWADRAGTDNLPYALLDAVEESLELLGLTLFLLALVDYLGERGASLSFRKVTEAPP